ncbi:patatin-like phospholipase, putative [Plasmodium knowlesi strain H]|uniref:Patatin-like phospholipase, putative n=3 Tax=Plasmodium knowlesi TaxID=5850 RepID=A0A5K1VRW2_PLAKH|nr:patatin-like phospholipase, putative [Plasmodium knowlesi strain H]OTN67266.1 putative Patatin-like phospholipase [Plasmodium knowlesi]CAA9987510.1 patatin-like phospholipase, putative [Plasmodium knowlesi strain H]SBO23154.1 patatin-like phospholipase, putative [Plasmodium knowlesi strain H]SBO23819.1 patatin-like phospholipase, putative [Plasmodium knowlesi strain H]VVS76984.1 patatin-like phospholipase, putative [Plasmodium knowlesi strain H]|eukprot:XP_002258511.1 hypothetical protein, conserved in Plasmodium species [Plasmodium knowlesi strain H]
MKTPEFSLDSLKKKRKKRKKKLDYEKLSAHYFLKLPIFIILLIVFFLNAFIYILIRFCIFICENVAFFLITKYTDFCRCLRRRSSGQAEGRANGESHDQSGKCNGRKRTHDNMYHPQGIDKAEESIFKIDRLMRSCSSYKDYIKYAYRMDELTGKTIHINENDDYINTYDVNLLKKTTQRIKKNMKNNDVLRLLEDIKVATSPTIKAIFKEKYYCKTYSTPHIIVTDFITHVMDGLEYVDRYVHQQKETNLSYVFSDEYLLIKRIFKDIFRQWGNTALFLSGGAILGLHHFGVLEVFLKSSINVNYFEECSAGGAQPTRMEPTRGNESAKERQTAQPGETSQPNQPSQLSNQENTQTQEECRASCASKDKGGTHAESVGCRTKVGPHPPDAKPSKGKDAKRSANGEKGKTSKVDLIKKFLFSGSRLCKNSGYTPMEGEKREGTTPISIPSEGSSGEFTFSSSNSSLCEVDLASVIGEGGGETVGRNARDGNSAGTVRNEGDGSNAGNVRNVRNERDGSNVSYRNGEGDTPRQMNNHIKGDERPSPNGFSNNPSKSSIPPANQDDFVPNFEDNILPQIICGTSAGSIVAAWVCSRTNKELLEEFNIEFIYEIVSCFSSENWLYSFFNIYRKGNFYDIDKIVKLIHNLYGDMTFLEAFIKTNLVLNITVTRAESGNSNFPCDEDGHMVLNYMNSPNVLIYTAVLASCSFPYLLQPFKLLEKKYNRENVHRFMSVKEVSNAKFILNSNSAFKQTSHLRETEVGPSGVTTASPASDIEESSGTSDTSHSKHSSVLSDSATQSDSGKGELSKGTHNTRKKNFLVRGKDEGDARKRIFGKGNPFQSVRLNLNLNLNLSGCSDDSKGKKGGKDTGVVPPGTNSATTYTNSVDTLQSKGRSKNGTVEGGCKDVGKDQNDADEENHSEGDERNNKANECIDLNEYKNINLLDEEYTIINSVQFKNTYFHDGSLKSDIPAHNLNQILSVKYKIVSQVNPHVFPFTGVRVHGEAGKPVKWRGNSGHWRGGFLMSSMEILFKENMRYILRLMALLDLSPTIRGLNAGSIAMQNYNGDITLHPKRLYLRHFKLISVSNYDDVEWYIQQGRQMTFQKLPLILNRMKIEKKLIKMKKSFF